MVYGSCKKDKNRGTFYFILEAGRDPITGKRKQLKRTGFKDRKEALLAMSKLQVEIEENGIKSITDIKFVEYMSDWFESKRIKLKPSTIRNYEEQIKYNILPYFENLTLKNLSEQILQNYIVYLVNERKLAPATVRTAFGIVAEIIKHASKRKIINEYLLSDISLPKETKTKKVWNEEEIKTFLNARGSILDLSRYYIGFVISLQTGMRMGEVIGLRWKDINFNNCTINISQTLSDFELVDGAKNDSSLRSIHISDSLIEQLIEHRKLIEKEKLVLKDAYINNDLVVCTQYGNTVHPNNFRRAFKRIVQQLELPEIRVHDLRHTHATFLLAQGVNAKIIQERLGHKNISVTLNTYSHVLPSMQVVASEKFDELFN